MNLVLGLLRAVDDGGGAREPIHWRGTGGHKEIKQRVHAVSWLFLGLSLFCQAVAVVLGKTAALRMGRPTLGAFLGNPWYLGGLACLVLQALFWQLVLREIRLFIAYLVTSLNYFLVLVASRFFFLERVTILNVIGVVIIVTGVCLVVRKDLS
jgi:drug/metabolite transporter (DMT)-like permease